MKYLLILMLFKYHFPYAVYQVDSYEECQKALQIVRQRYEAQKRWYEPYAIKGICVPFTTVNIGDKTIEPAPVPIVPQHGDEGGAYPWGGNVNRIFKYHNYHNVPVPHFGLQ